VSELVDPAAKVELKSLRELGDPTGVDAAS